MMGLPQAPDLRARMVELARSYVGEDASSPRGRYAELVAPADIDFARAEMLRMSGCALVVRGLWRLLGVEHESLAKPYRPGMAVADVVAIARSRGAWVLPGGGRLPAPGDVVLVGGSPARDGGVEHVYVVATELVDRGGHVAFGSIDGGQRTAAGHQTIRERSRVWRPRDGRTWDQAIDDGVGRASATRAVVGWADCERVLG